MDGRSMQGHASGPGFAKSATLTLLSDHDSVRFFAFWLPVRMPKLERQTEELWSEA